MRLILLFFLFFAGRLFAESKISMDLNVDRLSFVKPIRGVGKAGSMVFKYANIINNGIVLNVNNVNDLFDSQIFIRPTFMGFTTQFGSYGFNIEEGSVLSNLQQSDLQNAKIVLDDLQLNLAGQSFSFLIPGISVKVANFRLYCQNVNQVNALAEPTSDLFKNCFNFLTLNGSYLLNKDSASLIFEGEDHGDKIFIDTKVRSFDLRKNQINVSLLETKTASNDNYFMSSSEVNFLCAKDEDLKEVDFGKMKKTCLNQFKLSPIKVNISDKEQKTKFNIDIKDITIKDKILYATLNNVVLSDPETTTAINSLLLNCKKDFDTDLFDINQVLRDCVSYSRLSIGEINNNLRNADKKNSAIHNIVVSSDNGTLVTRAQVRFLGLNAKISIFGHVAFDEVKNKIIITVTDTQLPLGITSVKLLMYFLKKDLVSKDVTVENNVITITL